MLVSENSGGVNTMFWSRDDDAYYMYVRTIVITTSSLTVNDARDMSSSWGGGVSFGVASQDFSAAYLSDVGKYLVVMSRAYQSNCYIVVFTRNSGASTFTAGTPFHFSQQGTDDYGIGINGNKFCISMMSDSQNDRLYALLGSIASDGAITCNSMDGGKAEIEIDSTNDGAEHTQCEYWPKLGQYFVAFKDDNDNKLKRILLKQDGTSATISSKVTIVSDSVSQFRDIKLDPDSNSMLIPFTTGNKGKAIVRKEATTNVDSDNFIGFATAAISDTASGTVAVTGNTTTQSGLTAGKKYYVTPAGALSTTSTENVEAGIALSSTKLLIKG